MNYLAFDVENDNSKRYARDAGNFLYDQIVAFAVKGRGEAAIAQYNNDYGVFFGSCYDYQIVVGHNIKHDLLFIWPHIQEWLELGGKIWCTQLAEYMLTGQQHKYASLRDIAVNKYKCWPRSKHIDELLFKRDFTSTYWDVMPGVMDSIDRDQLMELAKTYQQVSDLPKHKVLEDVVGDVLNTEIVFLAQYEEAKRLGMLELIEFEMDALLATTEMEYNGFKVDQERLHINREKLLLDCAEYKNKLDKIISKYIDITHFSKKPKLALHCLLFGGTLKVTKSCPLTTPAGQLCFIKTGKNKGTIKMANKTVDLIIKGFGIQIKDSWKTEKGNVSIDETTLTDIMQESSNEDAKEFAETLLKIRGIEKEISTYYDRTLELTYDCDFCVHAKYHHCSTNTGRLSCSDPNMQNQPKTQILEHFITRFL